MADDKIEPVFAVLGHLEGINMPRSFLRRALLAALCAVVAWSGAARADGPYPAPPLTAKTPDKPGLLYKLTHPLEPCTCWTHYNSDYSCGTLRSEAAFIFGGCRSFFGEPCYKGGPPDNGPCTTGGCYKK